MKIQSAIYKFHVRYVDVTLFRTWDGNAIQKVGCLQNDFVTHVPRWRFGFKHFDFVHEKTPV